MERRIIFFTLALSVVAHIIHGLRDNKPVQVFLTKVEQKPGDYLSLLEIKVTNDDNNDQLVDFNLTFKKPPKRPTLRVAAQMKLSDGSYSKAVYNRTKDLCNIFAHPEDNPMFYSLYDIIVGYGRIPEKCPLTENFYYLKNFKLPSSTFPSWFPKTKFLLTITAYDATDKKQRLYFHVLLHGEIKKK